jgi:predicted RNA-binding Zn-ribbon protein involved in translation (DUF1610 family)
MTLDRLSHQRCPSCVVSMVGRKADLRNAGYDFFECSLCGTVGCYPFKEDEAKDAEKSTLALEC